MHPVTASSRRRWHCATNRPTAQATTRGCSPCGWPAYNCGCQVIDPLNRTQDARPWFPRLQARRFRLDEQTLTLVESVSSATRCTRVLKMGLFLSMTGVAGADRPSVERALGQFAVSRDGTMEASPANDRPERQLVVAGSSAGNVTVLYPSDFLGWDEASSYLSESLTVPVISMHIHDGDLWMYILFDGGREVGRFNPIPDYWSSEISDEERVHWAGDAVTLARLWPGVSEDLVQEYLVQWDPNGPSEKAYPSDQFAANDCWQLVDFMNKLHLTYPVSDSGKPLGPTFRFRVKRHRRS